MSEFNPQGLANTTWAFAAGVQSEEKLIAVLAKAAKLRVSEFTPQDFANTAWALATLSCVDHMRVLHAASAASQALWNPSRVFFESVFLQLLQWLDSSPLF